MSDEIPVADIDGALKEALHLYLEPAFALGFPSAHAVIDWSHGMEFMENELQKIVVASETEVRRVDLLVKVRLRTGTEVWLLLHIEIQAQRDPQFPERMVEYYFKIKDIFRVPVASFAIFADDNPTWKPDRVTETTLGTTMDFRYAALKLTDMDEQVLEASENPFAVIILAHLKAMKTSHDPERRRLEKFRLIKRLYEKWGRDEVRKLMRIIDWLMQLPKDLDGKFQEDVNKLEQEKQMSYVPTYERVARAEGLAEGLAKGAAGALHEGISALLKVKFGAAGAKLLPEILVINDVAMLRRIMTSIERSDTVDVVRTAWSNSTREA